MRTKQTFLKEKKKQKLDFSFSSFFLLVHLDLLHSNSIFSPIFFLVDGLSLEFIYEIKVLQETLKKVKFFNKKWHMVARPDFPSILPVKSDRFFACKSGPIHEINVLGTFLKGFFLVLLELVSKDIIYHKKDPWFRHGRFWPV